MPRPGAAPAPFIAPTGGDMDLRLSQVADAINRKADITSIPTYSSIHLIAPDGSTWMVSISTTGVLTTMQMPRP